MLRSEVINILKAQQAESRALGVRSLYVFGSTARDEAGPGSDVDLFVDPDYDRFGFVELLRLETILAARLGRPVDLTTREGLHPELRKTIEGEAVSVFR